ncbi:integral membrane protein [Ilyonectria robusta]
MTLSPAYRVCKGAFGYHDQVHDYNCGHDRAKRVYKRAVNQLNGPEDYLMYVGGVLNIGHNAAVMYGCFTGIGRHKAELNIPISI